MPTRKQMDEAQPEEQRRHENAMDREAKTSSSSAPKSGAKTTDEEKDDADH